MIMVEICLWLMFNTESAILYCLAVLKSAAASDGPGTRNLGLRQVVEQDFSSFFAKFFGRFDDFSKFC